MLLKTKTKIYSQSGTAGRKEQYILEENVISDADAKQYTAKIYRTAHNAIIRICRVAFLKL
ncbi:MAG TPA: hypothetical protein VE223_05575 [Nitrososphaeraceae archaeon]|nr:hypothetical protein [Nitrososphaeraceae archaeon]